MFLNCSAVSIDKGMYMGAAAPGIVKLMIGLGYTSASPSLDTCKDGQNKKVSIWITLQCPPPEVVSPSLVLAKHPSSFAQRHMNNKEVQAVKKRITIPECPAQYIWHPATFARPPTRCYDSPRTSAADPCRLSPQPAPNDDCSVFLLVLVAKHVIATHLCGFPVRLGRGWWCLCERGDYEILKRQLADYMQVTVQNSALDRALEVRKDCRHDNGSTNQFAVLAPKGWQNIELEHKLAHIIDLEVVRLQRVLDWKHRQVLVCYGMGSRW